MDGQLNFYEGSEAVCDREMERAFVEHTGWNSRLATPYFVRCSDYLAELFAPDTVEGRPPRRRDSMPRKDAT